MSLHQSCTIFTPLCTISETCRCRRILTTNWYPLHPYVSHVGPNDTGILPFILEPAIDTCCKQCTNGHGKSIIDYENDGGRNHANKKIVSELMHNINRDTDLSFPLVGYEGQDKYGIHKYVGLVESGGVAYVVMSESSDERGDAILHTILHITPVLALALLVLIIAGIFIWALVRMTSPEPLCS